MFELKSLFQCPVCSEILLSGEKQYFCSNGHCYDKSKKGYVNLLMPNHKGSGDPGDSKLMLESRRDFLNRGYYEKFADSLNEALVRSISNFTNDDNDYLNILDAGCGDGYYTSRLKNRLNKLKLSYIRFNNSDKQNSFCIYGIDVSKPAIHLASCRDKSISFAVASTYHTPILSGSMDLILCIFAPRDEKEFSRVLKSNGKLIVAAPGAKHLFSLKNELYESTDKIGQKGTVGDNFRLLECINVSYNIDLESNEDILSLFSMTPYIRHTEQSALDNLKKLNRLETEVDINIMLYEKQF